MFQNIPITVTSRQWMKAAKSWRVTLELPKQDLLPETLTGMIERQVNIYLQGEAVSATMEPAFIVDVLVKSKKFFLVAETMYEMQKDVGPHLTALVDTQAKMTITPATEKIEPKGDIAPESLRGLHVCFFPNINFRAYVRELTGEPSTDEQSCKTAFKAHMGVESCRHLTQRAFNDFIDSFNEWLNKC